MKKMNKKGFTIVELVIVIAVIAILAGVMIPTFGGVIAKAKESNRNQVVAAAYKDAYAVALSDGKFEENEEAEAPGTGFTFTFNAKGELVKIDVETKGMNDEYAEAADDADEVKTITVNGKVYSRQDAVYTQDGTVVTSDEDKADADSIVVPFTPAT